MAKRPKAAAVAEIRNEVLAPPIGETPIYTLILGDDDVEKLAHGRITQALIEQAWSMLSWKREYGQVWGHFECRCPECQLAREQRP